MGWKGIGEDVRRKDREGKEKGEVAGRAFLHCLRFLPILFTVSGGFKGGPWGRPPPYWLKIFSKKAVFFRVKGI